MQKLLGQRVGIWGLGVVGWSVLRYLVIQTKQSGLTVGAVTHLIVFEQRVLTASELAQLKTWDVTIATDLASFLTECAVIIPSPGIDLRPYLPIYRTKFLSELDLFCAGFTKPILAITGSLGKTTVTTAVGELLTKLGYRVGVGGNIGVGMCDLIAQQADLDLVVLELSSFQLELAQEFRAHWALWTNFCANHLDRHHNLTEYFQAKLKLLQSQDRNDFALVPAELGLGLGEKIVSRVSCFSLARVDHAQQKAGFLFQRAYYVKDGDIVREQAGVITKLVACDQLGTNILLINWVALVGLIDGVLNEYTGDLAALGQGDSSSADSWQECAIAEKLSQLFSTYKFMGIAHRLEFFAEIRGIKFYNDSKSTVPEATLAALDCLTKVPVILIIGGLSKGVNRESLIAKLASYQNIKQVICFGTEASALNSWCLQYGLASISTPDLVKTLELVWCQALAGDSVLFSPAGSSFDLFKNYQIRGQEFKQLVLAAKEL